MKDNEFIKEWKNWELEEGRKENELFKIYLQDETYSLSEFIKNKNDYTGLYNELRSIINTRLGTAQTNFMIASRDVSKKYIAYEKSKEVKFDYSSLIIELAFSLIVVPGLNKLVKKIYKNRLTKADESLKLKIKSIIGSNSKPYREIELYKIMNLSPDKWIVNTKSILEKAASIPKKKLLGMRVDEKGNYKNDFFKKLESHGTNSNDFRNLLELGFNDYKSKIENKLIGNISERPSIWDQYLIIMALDEPNISFDYYKTTLSNYFKQYDRSVRKIGEMWDRDADINYKSNANIWNFDIKDLSRKSDFPAFISILKKRKKFSEIKTKVWGLSLKHGYPIHKENRFKMREVFFLGYKKNTNNYSKGEREIGVFSSLFSIKGSFNSMFPYKGPLVIYDQAAVYGDGIPIVLLHDIISDSQLNLLDKVAKLKYKSISKFYFEHEFDRSLKDYSQAPNRVRDKLIFELEIKGFKHHIITYTD